MTTTRTTTMTAAVLAVPAFLACAAHGGDCSPSWNYDIGQPGMYGETGPFFGGTVMMLAEFENAGEPAVIAGGTMTIAGNSPVDYIAAWDGETWSPLAGGGVADSGGFGVPSPLTSLVFDDGSGEALYVGGAFGTAGGVQVNGIARYDGTSWSAVGGGFGGSSFVVRKLVEFEGELHAVGSFTQADGQTARGVARWDGKQWHAVGGGMTNNVSTATVFDDGTGDALYVGGVFTSYYDEKGDIVEARYFAKWDGEEWSDAGSNFDSHVYSMTVYDDGTGPALYAGGLFNWNGGVWAERIAKWNGSTWSQVGGGADNDVRLLQVINTAEGEKLLVGGEFTVVDSFGDAGFGPLQVDYFAAWDGEWSSLGSANDDVVSAVETSISGEPQLLIGGRFQQIDQTESNYIGSLNICIDDAVPGDLNGDGEVNVSDMLELLGQWGACSGCAADLNGNGSVDVSDLLLLLGNWT